MSLSTNRRNNFLFGTPYAEERISKFLPGQEKLASQLFQALQGGGIYGQGEQAYGQGMNYLSDLYNPKNKEAFNNLARPYQRQFQEQTVPDLASRFSGMGYGGTNSSGFQNTMGQAGTRMNENLASMFENLRSQNLGNLQGMSQMPFNQAQGALGVEGFEQPYVPPGQGLLGGLASGIGEAGGSAAIMALLKSIGMMV